jgi:hypothetical protein
MEASKRKRILDLIWPPDLPTRMGVWVVLDGARDERIYAAVDGCFQEKCCLYAGDLPWQLQMTAPYLVQLDRQDRFTDYLLNNGWGNGWGIFFRSETSMKNVRRHLRGLIRVRDQRGRRLIFRYWDPRVLRAYLPTCFPEELATVFGPVESFILEGEEEDTVTRFTLEGRKLLEQTDELGEAGARATELSSGLGL